LKNPDVVNLQDEFDSARLYLARWAMGIAEQSEREQQKILWTSRDIMELEDTDVGEFEILEMETSNMGFGDNRKPVSLEEWNKWFEKDGRLAKPIDEVKERIFHGGIEEGPARKEIWLWLLEVYPWDSTRDERQALMNSKRDEYIRLKGKWWDDLDRRSGDEYWRDQKNRIGNDCSHHATLLSKTNTPTHYRKGRPPHRQKHVYLYGRRHPASGSRLAIFRGRHECPPRTNEGHAPNLQRI
jgi:hypothetical protein